MLIGYSSALIFLFLLSISIFCFAYVLKFINVFDVTQLEIIIATTLVSIGLVFFQRLSFIELFLTPTKQSWCWLGLSGVVYFLGGNYGSLLNIHTTNEGNNSLLSPVITVLVSILSVLFLENKINIYGYLGLFITTTAVFLYQYKQFKTISKHSFLSGVICIFCTSLGIIFAIKGADKSGVSLFHSIFLRLFPVFILVLLNQIVFRSKLVSNLRSIRPKIFVILIIGVLLQTILSAYFWFLASFTLGVPQFQVIIALLPFCVAIISSLFFKKYFLTPRFYITALFAFVGVLLMFCHEL